MIPYAVDTVEKAELKQIASLWEESVRATHIFFSEENIVFYKSLLLNKYLRTADLRCVRDENKIIIGFLGVTKKNIDMLFIHPKFFGKGIGKFLINFAFTNYKADTVDVNEANKQAVDFYKHLGFKIISRSELDGSRKPYPILHMKLSTD